MTATSGIEYIAAERDRQINDLGYTADHDAAHDNEDLSFAAVCYAAPVPVYLLKIDPDTDADRGAGAVHWVEPWPQGWERNRRQHPVPTDLRIRELAKAGALIAAEIDKLLAQGD